ncbi:YncE family protein [Paenibacillus tritici]|uniref:YncE family protein n=1 Tax=Paenibacillus tritici TaxID=1873425 RepID=A0ABX2DKK1_9BACL|nr:YncE family protein [Paenibacillus tritici]NQX45147.1 YncE family protein [Paenibacillus tritici]QUL53183.1 YncE family protein [Paenibacillus tritici]
MNPNKTTANNNRNLTSGDPYVFVTYEVDYQFGYVAVIDPVEDRLKGRIPVGMNPGPMCMDPAEKKLYVVNTGGDTVTIIDTATFNILATVFVGNGNATPSNPVAVFVAAYGDKAYVANSSDKDVTIINTSTNTVITKVDMGPGKPFAFASNKNSPYVYAACRVADGDDYVVAISIEDDSGYLFGIEYELTFDGTRNPLTVHPDGHTQITLGNNGIMCFFDDNVKGQPTTFSLLDNTVSAVFLDNKLLFCTTQEGRSYLKRFTDLTVSSNGSITYEDFKDINSYKGQDKIRVSRNQKYIGVTIKPTTFPTGGLQIYNSTGTQSRFISLASVGDLAFFSDTKAYVGELSAIRPINLSTATALPAIPIGFASNDRINVKNIISGYRTQS